MAKWHEIFERYQSARLFLRKAYEGDWEDWFNPSEDTDKNRADDFNEYVRWIYKSELYETALINYNILVDLSWAITYVSAEYVLYKFDSDGNVKNADEIRGMHPIDEAFSILRKVENSTVAPTAENNPFTYLKVMTPEFSDAVDLIISFWRQFGDTNIRNLYNFIKHKGKPVYEELDRDNTKFFSIHINNSTYPSDIRDVQKRVSAEAGIQELIAFDNDKLFPYIKQLIKSLKYAVKPSLMIM